MMVLQTSWPGIAGVQRLGERVSDKVISECAKAVTWTFRMYTLGCETGCGQGCMGARILKASSISLELGA